MKEFLLKLYNWPFLPEAQANEYQKIIRDTEWEGIKPYFKKGKMLDVGCGTGYSLLRAKKEFDVEAYGIDPEPMRHGVHGAENELDTIEIKAGMAEALPYADAMFDVLYSSHVLEHVENKPKALQEMARVLKPDGVLIIGMPTHHMARIRMVNNYLFLTHINIVNTLFKGLINTSKTYWWEIFAPRSHSYPLSKTVFADIRDYNPKKWSELLQGYFSIEQVILPAYYSFPEYRQLVKLKKNAKKSSSVFFICRQKPITQ